VRIEVMERLRPLAGLRAEPVPGGVRVSWDAAGSGPGTEFRVWRRTPPQEKAVPVARVRAAEWLDVSIRYGARYDYSVQAVRPAGDADAESDLAGPVSVTPEDRFPPAAPSGLSALAGLNSIELTWAPNAEPDLRGYRLYRAAGGAPLVPYADLVEAPAFSDRQVEAGKRYRYAR
jgi:hypothetical protein